MERLEKYLEKINLEYTGVKFGGNYFQNVAPLMFSGVSICYEIRDAETCEKVRRLEKYAARYGYTVFNRGGYPGFQFFHVMKTGEKAELDQYNDYKKKAVNDAAEMIHLRRTGAGFTCMTDAEFNSYVSGMMDYYGECYKMDREYTAGNAA